MIETDQHTIHRYKHPAVRDLAWLLASPSLMQVESTGFSSLTDAWFRNQYNEYEDHLTWLDKHPNLLMEHIGQRHRRLGHYAESLIAYWLATNHRYQLIAQNLRIQVEGKTLGELDFVVLDRCSGMQCHWEVAVKFYLGAHSATCLDEWVGLQRQDCLQRKVNHLFSQQIERSNAPACQQHLSTLGIEIQKRHIWTKGRLYYPANTYPVSKSDCIPKTALPFISSRHLQGVWITYDTLLTWAKSHPHGRITWTNKAHWLGDLPAESQHLKSLLTGPINSQGKEPRSFTIQWQDQATHVHGFILP